MLNAMKLAWLIAHHVKESGVTDPDIVIEALVKNIAAVIDEAPNDHRQSVMYVMALVALQRTVRIAATAEEDSV
jgi:hypothetical protein